MQSLHAWLYWMLTVATEAINEAFTIEVRQDRGILSLDTLGEAQ